MDLKIIALCIICWYKIACLNAETSVTHKYFTVITDQRQTDKKTHPYVEWRKRFIGRALLRVPLWFFSHICNVKWYIKLAICIKILQFEEHGFHVGPTEAMMQGCTNTLYSVQFSTLAESETVSLTTVTCPVVRYTDLETGVSTDLPYIYKISNARKYNSAIMYVQKDKQSNEIYPLYFIKKIDFGKLKSKKYERTESLDDIEDTELSNTDDYIGEYLKARQTDLEVIGINFGDSWPSLFYCLLCQFFYKQIFMFAAYDKFRHFHLSMNICGRPRPQRMYLCRRSIKSRFPHPGIDFDLVGYDEDKCKQYDISLSENRKYEVEHFQSESKLFMFRCPPVLTRYRLAENYFYNHYLSSNFQHHSVTLFVRENDKGTLPKPEANISELQMEPIFKDIKRQRFLPGPPKIITESEQTQESYPDIEDEINSLEGEIAMPLTLMKSKSLEIPISDLKTKINQKVVPKIYLENWFLDRVTTTFSKVEKITLIYQRFMRAYKSIDLCALSIKQKTLLCNETFKKEKPETGIKKKKDEKEKEPKLPFSDDSEYTCTRNRVKLTTIEANELETNLFSMWECRGNLPDTLYKYYVSKNHLKNAATIYVRVGIGADDYYYPYLLIAGINKYGLIKDEMEQKIQEMLQLTEGESTTELK